MKANPSRSSICAFLLTVLCAGFAGEALAQDTLSGLQQATIRLADELEQSTRAIAGVSVYDLRTGAPLADLRGGEPFAPASNQKLLTAAFALAALGEDFHFTTCVYRMGDDIALVGDGDPTLGDPVLAAETGGSIYDELDRWAADVKGSFGEQPAGDLLLCLRRSPPSARHADWPASQRHRWYAAPVSELSFHNNCFDVTFSVADGRAVATVTPASRYIELVNQVTLGSSQTWSLRSNDDESQLTLKGTIRTSSAEPLSVAADHPPLMLARVLADRLVRAGVKLGGNVRIVPYDQRQLDAAKALCQTRTPLAAAIERANKRSLNMAAECILLRAGDGTWEGSAAAMTALLEKHYGVAPGEVTARDGSGLSRSNRVTPAAMARLLATAACRADAMTLIRSLPRGGVDGTLARRFADGPAHARVLGKTGYIAGASCLSGYILDADNRPALAFSILVNRVPAGKGWKAKQLQDALCEEMIRRLDATD